MKAQIVILSFLAISALALSAKLSSTRCSCSELQQADCTTASSMCTWSGTACSAKTLNCTFNNEDACGGEDGCAWNSNSTCSAFTQCSDYSATTLKGCYIKDHSCAPGTLANGSYPCVAQTLTSCSSITNNYTCLAYGCLNLTETTCGTKYCANITTQGECVSVGSPELKNLGLCSWNTTSGTCGDVADTTGLTSANCLTLTNGTYAWLNNACTACTGSSSSTLIAFIGFAATLLY